METNTTVRQAVKKPVSPNDLPYETITHFG